MGIGLLHQGATLRLRNGRSVHVRPVRPADAESIQAFVRRLSDASRRLRFCAAIRELAPAMLARLTEPADQRERVFLVEAPDGESRSVVALAQYAPGDDDATCDLALVVADAWQGLGLGSALIGMLIRSARNARCARAVADVLRDNEAMLALGRACGFAVARSPHGSTMLRLVRDLQGVLPTDRAWMSAAIAPQARPAAAFATL
jgi:acetyltransferase